MAVTVSGRVLKVERRAGNFNNDQGENIAYDFTVAKLLVDDDVLEVKFRPNRPDAQPPVKGADITVEVELPRGSKPTAVAYVGSSAK
jgi:hypothetical protein